jgi:hypothetical protein
MATAHIPSACQSIATRLEKAHQDIQTLQDRLQSASSVEKPRLTSLVSRQEALAAALENELSACVLSHQPVRPPTDVLAHSLILPVVFLGAGLRTATQDLAVRFHNTGSGDHRHSTVDIKQGGISKAGFPKDLGQLHSTVDIHLNDINSQSIQVLIDAASTPPLTLKVIFEASGTEVIVNNWPDKDLTLFSITMDIDLRLDAATSLLKLVLANVQTKAIVKSWLFGTHEDKAIEEAFNVKVTSVLGDGGIMSNLDLTKLIIGSNWNPATDRVVGVQRQGDNWTINYRQRPLVFDFR